MDIPYDVEGNIFVLDYEYFRTASTCDVDTLKKLPTYIKNKSYYISTLVLLARLIGTSAWPFNIHGQNYAVASNDGIWADVFDRTREALISSGRPEASALVRANTYAELVDHIDASCLPKYMGGTCEFYDLYGLCNRWADNTP